MGQSSAETVREIEDIRDRIESNVRELEDRLPQPAVWAKKAVGIAVGGGVGAIVLRSLVKRAGKKAKGRFSREDDEGGGTASKVWLGALTLAVIGMGVVQIRQLQRLNRGTL